MTAMGKPFGNSLRHHFLYVDFLCCPLLLLLLLCPVNLQDFKSDSSPHIEACPSECKCLDKGSIMTCRHGYLNRVPFLLSTTMILDLDDNKMSTLKNNSIENVPRLEVMSIQGNEITDVQSGAFLTVPELRILRLGNNHISSLPSDVFWNNRHLEVLDIHGNHFTEVPDSIMYHLHSLQLLNMSYNEVTSPYLGPGFKYTTQLRGLDLSFNNIVSLESSVFQSTLWWDETIRHSLNLSYCNIRHIHPYAFGKLYRLQVLSLEGNPLIDEDDLKGALTDLEVSMLVSLNLSWMNITNINDFFQKFQHRKLTELNLAHNNIYTIQHGTFFYLVNLERLDLSFNSISDIGDLSSLAKLRYLSLAYNTIDEISITTFEALHNLEVLDLSHNSLSVISDGPFQTLFYLKELLVSCNLISDISITAGLEHLQTLDISSNRLLNMRFVRQLPRLHSLDLSDNSLMQVPSGILSTSLLLLNLSSNMISSVDHNAFTDSSQEVLDLSYNRIEHLVHYSWSNIRELYMQGNEIFNVTDTAFAGLSSLEEVSLAKNHISWLPSSLFSEVNVRKLDISHNPLHPSCLDSVLVTLATSVEMLSMTNIHLLSVPHVIVNNLTSLRILDLSHNKLQAFPQQGSPSFHFLNISHNSLSTPNPHTFSRVHSIDLSDNPFACTCHLMPFRYWLLSRNISHTTHIIHARTYTCQSPPEWATISVRNFYVEGSSCNPHERVVIFTTVGCAVVVLFFTFLLAVYKFKCCKIGKFDSTRYSAIDDRLDQMQQEQRLVSCDQSSSSPATTSELQPNSLSSQPWL